MSTFIDTIKPGPCKSRYIPERDADCRFVISDGERQGMLTFGLQSVYFAYNHGQGWEPDLAVEPNGRSSDSGWELHLTKTKIIVWSPLNSGGIFSTKMKYTRGKATGGVYPLVDTGKLVRDSDDLTVTIVNWDGSFGFSLEFLTPNDAASFCAGFARNLRIAFQERVDYAKEALADGVVSPTDRNGIRAQAWIDADYSGLDELERQLTSYNWGSTEELDVDLIKLGLPVNV